jgi:hypothetical protein
MGTLIYMSVFGAIAAVVAKYINEDPVYAEKMKALSTFMHNAHMGPEVKERIRQYYMFVWKRRKGNDFLMCMHMCMHMCICVCICVYVYVYVHMYVYVYMYLYVYMCIFLCHNVYVYMYMYMYMLYMYFYFLFHLIIVALQAADLQF